MPSLLNKVNFTKGWPNPSIQEEVLLPDTGVTIEAGFIGRRKATDPDVWVLGAVPGNIHEEVFIFRNESDDPDAAREAHDPTDYRQVPFGGVQGISFQNPLEIETIQFGGTPALGDQLYADTDGKLKVSAGAGNLIIAVVTKALYHVGRHGYIRVVPSQKLVSV